MSRQILDVTLRDGGYLNNWDFAADDVFSLLDLMNQRDVEYCEIGYLSDSPGKALAASCPPDFLEEVRSRKNRVRISAMLRPSERQFEPILSKRNGLLDLIRIPCALAELDTAIQIASCALKGGFDVSLNLTSITAYTLDEICQAVRSIKKKYSECLLYLADSRGALTISQTKALVVAIRNGWDGRLGFHGHNNLGNALDNSLEAIESGCTFVDASVGGYGLGGGNTDLDLLLASMKRKAKGILRDEWRHLSTTVDDIDSYRLSGAKNLEQEWVPLLRSRYGMATERLVSAIPRNLYRSYEEVVGQIERYSGDLSVNETLC